MVTRRRFTTYYTAISTRLYYVEIKLYLLNKRTATTIILLYCRGRRTTTAVYRGARRRTQCGYRVIITVRCCCVQNNNATEYARTGFSTGLGVRARFTPYSYGRRRGRARSQLSSYYRRRRRRRKSARDPKRTRIKKKKRCARPRSK